MQTRYIWYNDSCDCTNDFAENLTNGRTDAATSTITNATRLESAQRLSLDRWCGVRWISDECLLLNVPRMLAEPSQTAFRVACFGQN